MAELRTYENFATSLSLICDNNDTNIGEIEVKLASKLRQYFQFIKTNPNHCTATKTSICASFIIWIIQKQLAATPFIFLASLDVHILSHNYPQLPQHPSPSHRPETT